jgi:Cdc6-like AAA superfamily ATPase
MAAPQSTFPERNPFPAQGTASVLPNRADGSVVADVQTPQLRHAWSQAIGYVNARSILDAEAPVLSLHGPAGSGKTHTLRYVFDRLAPQSRPDGSFCGASYVLSGTPDLNAIRYAILDGLDLETLRRVSRRFLEIIALEHVESGPAPQTAEGQQERAQLRRNLSQLGDLVRSALIDPSRIAKQQTEELSEGSEDFKNALSYLDDENLGKEARAWVCGQALDEETLRRLGVGKTRAADHSNRALRIVVRLFKRAGIPLLIMVDQCENFLRPDPKKALVPESVRFLQELVELLPQEKALFAIAMSEEVWVLLQSYLKQRVGLISYQFSVLTERNAYEFIHTYVHSRPPGEETEPDIFPFQQAAVREILASVRGNLRGFLQTCHEAFKLAAPTQSIVTTAFVQSAISTARRGRPSLQQVVAQVRGVLRDRGLDLSDVAPSLTAGTVARLSKMIENRAGTPIARMEASESLFIDDEARQGLTTVDVIERTARGPRAMPVIVLVVGYASPEIVTRLLVATPHVLLYDPDQDDFRARLIEVLDKFQREQAVQVQAVPPAPPADLEALRNDLARLVAERTSDAQRTTVNAVDVLQKQEEVRVQDLWRNARADWVGLRKQIEEQIRSARAARLSDELSALESERARAASERSRRLAVAYGLLAILLEAGFLAWLRTAMPLELAFAQYTGLLFIPLAVGAVAWLIDVYLFPGAMWGTVRSIRELDDLVAKEVRKRFAAPSSVLSSNPQIRYAAARQLGMRERPYTGFDRPVRTVDRILGVLRRRGWDDIDMVARTESNVTVRRALAQEHLPRHFESMRWPERVYAFSSGELDGELLKRSAPERAVELIEDVRGRRGMLKRAYERGFTSDEWLETSRLAGRSDVQAVLRALSPFDPPGLGTFDYLQPLSEIDELYLFFRQWMHYIDLDLPVLPPRTPSAVS